MHRLGFLPGKTLIHQLYPVTKFIWLLIISVFLFILDDSRLIGISATVLLFILIQISHNIWKIRGFRFALFTGVSIFLMYLFFNKTGETLLSIGLKFFDITSGGLEMGLRISGRFLAIIFISYIFILTTNPNQLAYSLMKLGLPYRYGFMLVTALRLAPILEDEGQAIYKAQLVRGVRYDKKGLKRLLLIIQQFLSPLVFSALQRADKLVFSMEGRGFGRYPTRTFYDQTKPSTIDFTFSIGLLLIIITCLWIDIGGII